MANKAKELQRLDAEIERCREEGEWRRLLELSMSRRSKISFGRVSPMEEALTDFLVGEARLEAFLVEYPPTEENIAIACRELHEPKRLLSDCLGDAGQKAGVALDAKLLLGKLAFAEGDYDAAINCFTEAKLRSLKEKALAIRAMKMTAESFAVLGMSLEKVPPSSNSRFRVSERQEEVIACFDRASDLGLLFAQQTAHMEASGSSLGLLLESAITRAPVLLVTAGQLDRALSRFRATLSAVEMGTNSQRLRLAMFQSFGKFLLRGFCQANYSQPKPPAETSTSVSRWQPKRHLSSWIPRSVHEETILVILLAEAMAVREAVLSRSSDARVEEARTHSLKTAFTVHDLLTIALVRWREPSVIVEALERHLKFAFEETHIWGQYAMALSTLGKHARALRALEETMRIDPNDSLTRLLAARTCYEHLNLPEEGLKWSNEAIAIEERGHETVLHARAYLFQGLGHLLIWRRDGTTADESLRLARRAFQEALQRDEDDHLILFYLALVAAHKRKLSDALALIRRGLQKQSTHISSLHLLCLLLSATGKRDEAMSLILATLREWPGCLPLMYFKAKLQEELVGAEAALGTAREMLSQWKLLYEEQTRADAVDAGGRVVDGVSVAGAAGVDSGLDSVSYNGEAEKDNASITGSLPGGPAASHVEQSLSEVASSVSSYQPRPGPHAVWMMQVNIWLLISELYLSVDQIGNALSALEEAYQILPLSHLVMFTRGLIYERLGDWAGAKQCFQNALAISPTHVRSLRHMGNVYLHLRQPRLAEQTLREALKLDPMDYQVWYSLGQTLDVLGDATGATEAFATALDLETTSPVVNFSMVPIPFL